MFLAIDFEQAERGREGQLVLIIGHCSLRTFTSLLRTSLCALSVFVLCARSVTQLSVPRHNHQVGENLISLWIQYVVVNSGQKSNSKRVNVFNK